MGTQRTVLWGLVVLCVFGVAARAEAQGNPAAMAIRRQMQQHQQMPGQQQQQMQQQMPMQPQVQTQSISLRGTIENIGSAGIQIVDEAKQPRLVRVGNATKVQVTGEATVDFLAKGQIVEFDANLNENGTTQEALTELSVISPSRDMVPGVTSGPHDEKAAKARSIQPGKNHVLGRVVNCVDNRLIVAAGRFKVYADVTDDTTVSLDLTSLSLVAKGDKVSVEGMTAANPRATRPNDVRMQQPQNLPVQATSIKIEIADVLSGEKKKTPPKADAKADSKTDAKAGPRAGTKPLKKEAKEASDPSDEKN